MDVDDTVLSGLDVTEDGDAEPTYYTILMPTADNLTLELTDQQELLDTKVFYLTFENENTSDEQEEESDMSMLQGIVLPDGTHAYFTKNIEKDTVEEQEACTLKQEHTTTVNGSEMDESANSLSEDETSNVKQIELYETDIVNADNVDNFDKTKYENVAIVQNKMVNESIQFESASLSSEEEDVDIERVQEYETDMVNTNSEEVFDKTKYEQIQLDDGSVAMIELGLYKSIVDQSKKKSQSNREIYKAYDCHHANCNKSYTTMHHLRVHMRNHTGNRPYRCEAPGCDKAFSTGYSLKAHSRTHTGEKPYGCQFCFKSFKTSGDLQKHVRIHTGEKPFMCPIEGCGRSFTTSNIRKVHIRSHTGERPYQCTEVGCHKAFASATNFKNHMRIHSGEKPYACSVEDCGKRFTEYSSLYKHQLVHTNTKPYKCVYCGRTFRQPSTLDSHKRSAHNIIITENGSEIMLKLEDSGQVLDVTDVLGVAEEETEQVATQIVFVAE